MFITILGFAIVVSTCFQVCFPDLVKALKANDNDRWFTLGSPPEYDFSKSFGVFSWVLAHGFEQSNSREVVSLGARAYKKALTLKYSLVLGLLLVGVGFVMALLGI